jgi:mono/diheme cytochrome c family protein
MTLAKHILTGAVLLASLTLVSCRGQLSEKPPIHPNPNMDFQDRFNAQESNSFFEDGRSMRTPVEGTVARGNLRLDRAMYEGLTNNGNFVEKNPMELTRDMLYRGKARYDIFCTMCHGGTGNGQGVIMTGQYGFVPAPSFHDDRIRNMPDGELYSAIAKGVRTMPSYASQIPVDDRWAIVAYVRALQRSQNVEEMDMSRFDVNLSELQQAYDEEVRRREELAAIRAAGAGDPTADRGERLFIQNGCQGCHSVDGSSLVGPTLLGLHGSEREFVDGTTATADEEYLRESILEPSAKIVVGYDNVMVSYDFLSSGDIESLILYIKSLSDN